MVEVKEKYFLVSPGEERAKKLRDGAQRFLWMRETDGQWVRIVNQSWRERHKSDIIQLCSIVESPLLLDWSRAYLHNNSYQSGWLNRDGRFYGCPENYHDKLAYFVLCIKVGELEQTGWVRVNNPVYYTHEKRLSEEQKNWLSTNGHKVYD